MHRWLDDDFSRYTPRGNLLPLMPLHMGEAPAQCIGHMQLHAEISPAKSADFERQCRVKSSSPDPDVPELSPSN